MKKNVTRVISCLLVLVLVISSLGIVSVSASDPGIYDGTSVSASLAGEGTEASPFLISSGADLAYFAQNPVDGAHYKLTTDIYWSAYVNGADKPTVSNWTPVKFNGTFDGDGHTVAGINVVSDNDGVGFFGEAYGVIKNLNITDSYFNGANGVGAIVGIAQPLAQLDPVPSLEIRNCSSNARVVGKGDLGGIIGKAFAVKNDSTETTLRIIISQCISYCTLFATNKNAYSGGIVGRIYGYGTDSGIFECANFGVVAPNRKDACVVGGIVGQCGISGTEASAWGLTISDCVNLGEITAYRLIGGIVGRNYGITTIQNCLNLGPVTASGETDSYKVMFGAISGYESTTKCGEIKNTYYLEKSAVNTAVADAVSALDSKATSKTAAEINSAAMAELLGDKWTYNETDGLTLVAFATEADNPGSGDSAMIVVCTLLAAVAVLGSALVVKKVVKSK